LRLFRLRFHSAVFSSSSFFETAARAFASFANRWKGESELFGLVFIILPDYARSAWFGKQAISARLSDKFIEG
jgi:hypothetical protein